MATHTVGANQHEGADRIERYQVPLSFLAHPPAEGPNVPRAILARVDSGGVIVDATFRRAAENNASVILHGATHSYRRSTTESWKELMGAASMRHDRQRPLTVEVIAPDHPVMRGFPAKWETINEELYEHERVWPTMMTPSSSTTIVWVRLPRWPLTSSRASKRRR